MSTYDTFAAQLCGTALFDDPWLEGGERFRREPVVLTAAHYRDVATAAAAIAAVHDELAQIVTAEPALLDSYFGLTAWQRGMWQCSAPDWHGIARADVFWTADGPKVCELNSDTPSGEAEAVTLNDLVSAPVGARDPNADLPRRFVAMVEAWGASCGHRGPLTIGLLYPTEMPEDLSMVAIYQRWLAAAGHRCVLGSPFNVTRVADGRAALFDQACDVIVRHYKTDWFGERLPVADDEPLPPDQAPLAGPLLALLAAAVERRTAIVNPFGAVLTQNKRALAFCHEHRQRFSAAAQAAVVRYLPPTVRLELVRDELWHQRDRWVLKSDYGCEGDEVVVGPHVDQTTWESTLATAVTRRWVAQQYFAASPAADGTIHNHGIYLCGGAAAGILLRTHGDGPTDRSAVIAPAFVAMEDGA
jgi:glutathionylspermidine synthase